LWIIRSIIVVALTSIGYFHIAGNIRGILTGFAVSCAIIALELLISRIKLDTLVASGIGAVLGFVTGNLVEYGLLSLDNDAISEIMGKYSLLVKSAIVVTGILVAVRKKEEVDLLDKDILRRGSGKNQEQMKILDTSIIIDGRIADICETKFLMGPLIIPQFVLAEMQKLADSADTNKRTRARRGLEILHRLQEESDLLVKVYDKDYPEWKDVDTKLVALAKEMNGLILTTDFNLNKIATLQGVIVLNINDLASALKPIFLPGEMLNVYVVKEGKERDQGVGYLDDGTMIVIEEGRKFVGRKIDVVVTSMLQTSAGRMIFTRPK